MIHRLGLSPGPVTYATGHVITGEQRSVHGTYKLKFVAETKHGTGALLCSCLGPAELVSPVPLIDAKRCHSARKNYSNVLRHTADSPGTSPDLEMHAKRSCDIMAHH